MNDPCLGELIRTDCSQVSAGDIIIVGIPTDEGVKRNGGRIGAAQAPDSIRTYLRKLTPIAPFETEITVESLRIFDHGNTTGSSLEDIHSTAKETIRSYTSKGCFVLSLGGGHDITYPAASGVSAAIGKPLGMINIDAHLDVREKKNGLHHSGSSFRLLIEDRVIPPGQFTEFGIQPFAAAKEHINWAKEQGSNIIFFNLLQANQLLEIFQELLSSYSSPFYLSFDIDSIRSSDAPGCSAPSPIGFTSEEAMLLCYLAGRHPLLSGFDIVEVNPLFDPDARTARLAARMMGALFAGIASR